MSVNRNGRKPLNGGNIGEVLAEAFFVDAQIVGERQQDGGDHAVRRVRGMAGHFGSPRKSSSSKSSVRSSVKSSWCDGVRPWIGTDPARASVARSYIMPGPAFAKTPANASDRSPSPPR